MSSTVSSRFAATTPTTIAFVSRDNTTFHIERAKLDRAADFSPPSSIASAPTELVRLTEHSRTLDLLFRYVYCDVTIDLDQYTFNDMSLLAEAADKYLVFSAMSVCRLYMKGQYMAHPIEVMIYAVKHDHRDILDVAAPYTIGNDLAFIKTILPASHVPAWVQFNDEYQSIARGTEIDPPRYHPGDSDDTKCDLGDEADETWSWLTREVSHTLLKTGARALLDTYVRGMLAREPDLSGLSAMTAWAKAAAEALYMSSRTVSVGSPAVWDAGSRAVWDTDMVFTAEMLRSVQGCEGCDAALGAWREGIVDSVAKIPGFTTYL